MSEMKFLLLYINFLVNPTVNTQTIDKFEYRIKLDGVTTPWEAKSVIDYIKEIFNTKPEFYDPIDTFIFTSGNDIERQRFYILSLNNGYSVIFFQKTIIETKK